MSSVRRVAWVVSLGFALAAFAGACKRGGEAATDHSYEVRGMVRQVAPSALFIEHEAIPDFIDRTGKKVGMASMAMSFGLGPGLSSEELAPGDKLSFSFDVRFEGNPVLLITRMQKLPPDTELAIGGAMPPHP